jgi:BASS family bile acid:Na+ symporter
VSGRALHVPVERVIWLVLSGVVLPLLSGMLARWLAPGLALRGAGPISLVGKLLLVLAFVPLLIVAGRSMLSLIGDGTLLALALFSVTALLIGHLLGGPRREQRAVLAITTATRHPAIAIAIAQASFPQEKLVAPAVLLSLLVSEFVSIPYIRWLKRHAQTAQPAMSGVESSAAAAPLPAPLEQSPVQATPGALANPMRDH